MDALRVLLRHVSLTRRLGWLRLARFLGIVLQSLVLGELLFGALLKMHAIQYASRVFRYMGF